LGYVSKIHIKEPNSKVKLYLFYNYQYSDLNGEQINLNFGIQQCQSKKRNKAVFLNILVNTRLDKIENAIKSI
jgi:hypothetical protein